MCSVWHCARATKQVENALTKAEGYLGPIGEGIDELTYIEEKGWECSHAACARSARSAFERVANHLKPILKAINDAAKTFQDQITAVTNYLLNIARDMKNKLEDFRTKLYVVW